MLLVRIILRLPRRGFASIQKSRCNKNVAWDGVTGGQAGEVMVEKMMVQWEWLGKPKR